MARIARTTYGKLRQFILILLLANLCLAGCQSNSLLVSGAVAQTPTAESKDENPAANCPVTQPAWVKPPKDSAVMNEPEFGYYYVNEDETIWASSYYSEDGQHRLRATKEGNKMGWFRPTGAEMEITGRRIDAESPPMKAEMPCCYPTRFQATGLYFSMPGCWEITAKAGGKELTFVVTVES